jgi:hypothetical protein
MSEYQYYEFLALDPAGPARTAAELWEAVTDVKGDQAGLPS